MKITINLDKAEDIFDYLKLKEHTAYLVRVKWSYTNVEHDAILFVGFRNGNYCEIYSNSYDRPMDMSKAYSIKIKKILTKLK